MGEHLYSTPLVLQVVAVALCYLTAGVSSQTTDQPAPRTAEPSDLRFAGGGQCRGRLEVITQTGTWAQACDNSFGNSEAQVVCRELGCSNFGAFRQDATLYGFNPFASNNNIQYARFNYICGGYESDLSQCIRNFASRCDQGFTDSVIAINCGDAVSAIVGGVLAGVFALIAIGVGIGIAVCFLVRWIKRR